MASFKIKYTKEAMYVATIEADSLDDALQKYEDGDFEEDYEDYGIRENIQSIEEVED